MTAQFNTHYYTGHLNLPKGKVYQETGQMRRGVHDRKDYMNPGLQRRGELLVSNKKK